MYFTKRNLSSRTNPSCVLVGVLFLSGCAVVPDRKPLDVALPAQFGTIAAVQLPMEEPAAWWEHFNDPHLNGLIDAGLAGSPAVREARLRLAAAQHTARAAGLRFDGDANFSATRSSEGATTRSAGLGLDLLPFGGRAARLARAEATLAGERQALRDAQISIASDIAAEYVNLRYFQALLQLRLEELQLARNSQSAAESRARLNEATEFEVLEARALVAEVQAGISEARASILSLRRELAVLLGVLPTEFQGFEVDMGPQPIPSGIGNIGVPADLLRHRPDIRQAEHAYEIALASVGIARANRLPRLSLDGTIRAPAPGDDVRSGTLSLAMPVFAQPALAAEEDAALAQAEQAYHAWERTVISAAHEVEQSLAAISLASEALSAARRAERIQAERAALTREALSVSGELTVLDIIDSDRTLSRNRERTINSLRRLGLSYIELWQSLGVVPQHSTEMLLDDV